jgi:mono/diheme cytochrome c family protein
MKSTKLFLISLLASVILISQGCYKDNEQDLYQNWNNGPCDTAAVSYSTSIAPVIQNSCQGCHGNSSYATAGAGINLEGYSNLSSVLTNIQSTFIGSIVQDGSASNMPKGGNKLDLCSINKIKAWISQGIKNH